MIQSSVIAGIAKEIVGLVNSVTKTHSTTKYHLTMKKATTVNSLTGIAMRPTYLLLTENNAIVHNLIETLGMVSSVTWNYEKNPTMMKYWMLKNIFLKRKIAE